MKSLNKIFWIGVLSFTLLMLIGCAGISKKQEYLNRYKVASEGTGCMVKGVSIKSGPNILRSESVVKRVGMFIFPAVLVNYWYHKYDYDIGNEFFDGEILIYIQTRLQKNKALCELVAQNDSLSLSLYIKEITIKGSFIMHNYLSPLFFLFPHARESGLKITSKISSDIQIRNGRKVIFENSISTAYKTPGQVYARANPAYKHIPMDIKNNFNSCLNKVAGEIAGYASIAIKKQKSSLQSAE